MIITKKISGALASTLAFLFVFGMVRWVWAGVIGNKAQPENDVSAVTMGVPLIWSNPHLGSNGLGLDGTGQVIGVADTGLDRGNMEQLHPDLIGKIMAVKDYSSDGWDDPFGHGTHIAASIVGSGKMSGGRLKGIASGAQIYFQSAFDKNSNSLKLPAVYQLLSDAYYTAGVRIHSDSWGFKETSGKYDTSANSLDQFVYDHPDMLVLKSAGNFAQGENSLVTSPGSAKNGITIGASKSPRGIDSNSDNPLQVASFSCRGTTDGRIKPDLVAPGTWILSASSDENSDRDLSPYTYLSGTSMSTALATGATALVRQYFTDLKKIYPSAALIKGALIQGARDLLGESRQSQGFGLIDVESSLMSLRDSATVYRDGEQVNSGETNRYQVSARSGAPLRMTLVWSDYPQQVGAGQVLVNDLDLKVTAPDGRVLWGNNILGGDRKNNVEVITINHPQSGTYTVDVKGSRVPKGPQSFSIIAGNLPVRGTVVNTSQGKAIRTDDGQLMMINANISTVLVNNSQRSSNVPFKDVPSDSNAYYLPGVAGSGQVNLEAVYESAYDTLISHLKLNHYVSYGDMQNHWAKDVVNSLSYTKVVGGYPDGTFRPNDPVTRAQFASMLVRALKISPGGNQTVAFGDVAPEAWYSGAINDAANAGLVAGKSNNTFAPNEPITREQMAVMITRAIGGGEIAYRKENGTLDRFGDKGQISSWAVPSVALMVGNNIFSGRTVNAFQPQGVTTRGEAAAGLARMLALI